MGFLNLSGQNSFDKPHRRSQNLLDLPGPSLKTIYSFEPLYYDTIHRPGAEPVIISKYGENQLVSTVFNAVFSDKVKVYNPNYWGTVPHLLEKHSFEIFDTIEILNYLSAGWDTSLMIDNNGNIEEYPEYKEIPYDELSGIFFYESWWLDEKDFRMYKDIIAYLPIRDYISVDQGYENTEIRRRLLFMVIPERSLGILKSIKYKPSEFRLLWKDVSYNFSLYNKPYEQYLFREENNGSVTQSEYNEWLYHHFDFYRDFDADLFLEKIITGVLDGELNAYPAGSKGNPLEIKEIIKMLKDNPENEDLSKQDSEGYQESQAGSTLAEISVDDYPLGEINSLIFHEDWYIHPESLQIFKDVKGITLNRHITTYDKFTGKFQKETVSELFTVWF